MRLRARTHHLHGQHQRANAPKSRRFDRNRRTSRTSSLLNRHRRQDRPSAWDQLVRLTDDQIETLKRLGCSVGVADTDALVLERYGLCITGEGRFGSWARITDAGQQYLDRKSSQRGCRASPRQVLAAPAPKAAASSTPGRGSRAGSSLAAGTPCVVRHDVPTPLPRTVSTPERRKPGASQDRATSTRMRAQTHKVAPPTTSSARPLPSKSSGVASLGDAKAAIGSRQGHVPASRVSRKPATTARAPTERALASATPTSTTRKSR